MNEPGFKGILGFLEPDYQVPSRTHVASLIKKRHQNGKQELGGLLRAAPAVALTTDAWTSRATQSYATYTAHFISETWKLESYVLRTSRDYPHLAVLARRFLCIPATSVPAERVFSAAGIIVNKLRCSLQHNNVDALIFLQKNRLQSTRSGIAELPALPVTATEEINKEDVLQEELELDSPDLPCLD